MNRNAQLAGVFFLLFLVVAAGSVQTAKLTAGDPSAQAFGWTVAKSGATIVVGSQGYGQAGAAYVFVRQPGGWVQQAKLQSGETGLDLFGSAIAIDGDTLAVGARNVGVGGTVFVYERSGSTWTPTAELTSSDVEPTDGFGQSVALEEDRLVVGAVFDADNGMFAGSVYVFERAGTDWTETAKLVAADGVMGDQLGGAVALSGDRLVAGAVGSDTLGMTSGAAYVFRHTDTGWVEEEKLLASDGSPFDFMGLAVDIEADRVVAGAPFDSPSGFSSGSAYVFERGASGWHEEAKLVYGNAAPSEYLGHSIAFEGTRVATGAFGFHIAGRGAGAVRVFSRCGTSWLEDQLVGSDTIFGDELGRSVAIEGRTIVAGAPFDDDVVSNAGSAYVFELEELFTSYCTSAPNSAGDGARLSAEGCNVVAANDVTLVATGAPARQPALFFFGTGEQEVPFGGGFLCVAGAIERLNPPVMTNALGRAERPVDLTAAPAAGNVTPGATTRFQLWYRDPAGGGFNLSDALRALWE